METKWVSQEVCDERHKSLDICLNNYKKIMSKYEGEIRDIQDAIVRLATLAEKQDSASDDHENRIRTIEAKPGKIWDNLIIRIGSILIAAALGGFMGNTF